MQRRTTKMVEGLEGYSYSDRLRKLVLTIWFSQSHYLGDQAFWERIWLRSLRILKALRMWILRSWEVLSGCGWRWQERTYLQIIQEKVQIGCWAIQVCESGVRGVERDDVVGVGMMMWLGWGQWMRLRGSLIITWGTWGGIFKQLLCSLLIAIHGDLLLEAWVDPGNPGKSLKLGYI